MLSMRLTEDIKYKIDEISRNESLSKTDVVKEAIELYFNKYNETINPYAMGKDLFGKYGSGKGNLSKDYKSIIKGKMLEKHSH